MAIQIRHHGHHYTYRHPAGWSGGDEQFRKKLNENLPAGEYPCDAAEELAVKHALKGVLAGGEVFRSDSGRPVRVGREAIDEDDLPVTSPAGDPERILGTEPHWTTDNPDRILETEAHPSNGDPDRILESDL